jgi:hypothetical protein
VGPLFSGPLLVIHDRDYFGKGLGPLSFLPGSGAPREARREAMQPVIDACIAYILSANFFVIK